MSLWFVALGLIALQLISWLLLPISWLWIRKRTASFLAEEIWALGILAACLQAITGSVWSLLTPFSSTGQLLLWGLSGIALGEVWHRLKLSLKPLESKGWFAGIIVVTLVVRLLPAYLHSGLGQSDAYSHLQFGGELLESGRLSHYIYPTGYGWVNGVALKLFHLDPYLLYRFGGATAGLALVVGVFFVARRASNEKVAQCAALLVAGCPLLLPLIKTGVGVFPNQFGLLLLPFLLWAVPKNVTLSLLAFTALGLSVPIMTLDVLPVFLLYLCIQKEFRKLAGCFLVGVAGSILIWVQLSNLSPLHLEVTLNLLTNDLEIQTITELFLHYISPKSFSYPWPVHVLIGAVTLTAGSLVFFPFFRKQGMLLIPLLTLYSGFQTTFGIFQFANYQRAGWVFLLGFAFLAGWLSWNLSRKLHLQKVIRPLLALSSLLLVMYPVTHQKQLSLAEDELVEFLWKLSKAESEVPVNVWARPFNDFGGQQGDPVRVFLGDRNEFKLRRPINNAARKPNPKQPSIVIIETLPPPQTGHPGHDEAVRLLWEQNDLLRESLASITEKERVDGYPGLDIWYWPASLLDTLKE